MKTNVHVFREDWKPKKILLVSDLHWDNPHCNRELLKKHLDEALEGNCDVLLNGDTFCLMQGAYDPRKAKSDIRPEHNVNNYLDAVIETAIEWFKPYANIIKVVGYGNHETSILKRQETDVVARFVDGLNSAAGSDVKLGGYGGWIVYRFRRNEAGGNHAYRIKYHHGFGGGGPVTKGSIQFNRMSTFIENADLIWMGHVHEDQELTYTVERITPKHIVQLRNILMVRTPTYKEEYDDGRGGWHVERGAPPKPLGGRWLELFPTRDRKDTDTAYILAKTHKAL